MKYQYFEVIPTMCGDSFALTSDDNGELVPVMEDTWKAVQDEIDDINQEWQEQIKAGERDEGDLYDGFPQFGFLDGDELVYCEVCAPHAEISRVNWRDAT